MKRSSIALNQRPIPEAALRDENAVEMVRVWIAERGLHCSIRVGMYHGNKNLTEVQAWGMILADVAKHVANALHIEGNADSQTLLGGIRDQFVAEIENPTSKATGSFSGRN